MTAPSEMDERLYEEALDWHRALLADDADWAAYTLWLEADPRHAAAFDAVALTDSIVDEHHDSLRFLTKEAAVESAIPRPRRRGLAIGAIAAALAVAVAAPVLLPRAQDTVYATAASETRRITLSGGTAIDIAPASRLLVKGGDPRNMELAGGEVFFAVDHDPGRVLTIHANGYAVTDIGTKFAMNLAHGALLVGVAEGRVSVGKDGTNGAVSLGAGQRMIAEDGSNPVRVSSIPVAEVGSWRQGRLVYDNAPLSVVVADIGRYWNKSIVMDSSVAGRRFSGVLTIGDGSKLLANLSDFMALSFRVEGNHVRVSSGTAR